MHLNVGIDIILRFLYSGKEYMLVGQDVNDYGVLRCFQYSQYGL